MTDKILYRVLGDEDEEIARIFFEIKETGEQIEGSHQIQKWINNVFNENEQLKQFIQSLAEQSVNGKVMLRDGKVYDLNEILKKGDVE